MLRLAARISLALTCSVTLLAASLVSQVPTPESVIGWKPGADYKLADYDQLAGYFRQLEPRGTFKLIFNAILKATAEQQRPTTEEDAGAGR